MRFYYLNLALAKVAPDMKKRRMGSNRIKRLITVRPDTGKNLRKKLCLKNIKNRIVDKTTIVVAVQIGLTTPPPPTSSTLQLTQQKGYLTSLSFQPYSSCMEGRDFAVSASKGAT
jgi:hypothetical protein